MDHHSASIFIDINHDSFRLGLFLDSPSAALLDQCLLPRVRADIFDRASVEQHL